MTRRDIERLDDIFDAIDAIRRYAQTGIKEEDLVYDACRVRLIEIGEAVKHLSPELLANNPTIPWQDIARMRDRLAHRYFDTDHARVQRIITEELEPLRKAVEALRKLVGDS